MEGGGNEKEVVFPSESNNRLAPHRQATDPAGDRASSNRPPRTAAVFTTSQPGNRSLVVNRFSLQLCCVE
jgi:hypothetical protein